MIERRRTDEQVRALLANAKNPIVEYDWLLGTLVRLRMWDPVRLKMNDGFGEASRAAVMKQRD